MATTLVNPLQAPKWIRRGAFCTDGQRLYEISSLTAAITTDSRGQAVTAGGIESVMIEDSGLDAGALQPPRTVALSEFVATMRAVVPGA